MVRHTSQSFEKYALWLLESFSKLKHHKIPFDCAIKVGDKDIPAHSFLLAANSGFLREEISGGENKITFNDLNPEAVELCVSLIYGQHADKLEDKIEDVLQVSSRIKFYGLMDFCFDYMEENLSVQNCFTAIQYAELYNRNEVVASVEKFIIKNFEDVIETEKFLLLSKVALLHYIEISNAECQMVWRAVTKWTEVKKDDNLLLELMIAINMKSFPINFLIETVWEVPQVQDSAKNLITQCIFSDLERLKAGITYSNCFLVKSFSEAHNTFNSCAVKDMVARFMAKNFSRIKDEDGLILLDFQDLSNVIRDSEQTPATEKWLAVVKWTRHDLKRSGYFAQLVKAIGVEALKFSQLLDIVWKEPLTQNSESTKEFIANVLISDSRKLEANINIANCFLLMDINMKYNSFNYEKARTALLHFMAEHLGEISEKKEFLTLDNLDVLSLLKNATSDETTRWRAVTTWLKFNESRENYLRQMLDALKMEEFSVEFIAETVYIESLVQESEIAKALVVENLFSSSLRLEISLDEGNCCILKQIFDDSCPTGCDGAEITINRYMMLNLERVGLKREFLELNFNGLASLFKAPEAVVQSVSTTWAGVLKWVKHNKTREAYLPKLIEILEIQDSKISS